MSESNKKGKITESIRRSSQKIQAKWRKIVTGNEKKRIRDHLKEAQQQPHYVKLMDKLGFTMGVLNITACQYFLLNIPEYFPIWYAVVVPVLLISRLYHFRSQNWHYFLLDFCYFVILCTLLNITVLRSDVFFKMCFIFATGSLPIAIPVWRNSLIFHDYDKIVSVYVHILPCMLYYTLRWHEDYAGSQCLHAPQGAPAAPASSSSSGPPCPPLLLSDYLSSLLLYFAWQVMYILKTEVWDKRKLDNNPNILTSLRWMAKDTKNATARSVLRLCRRIGVFGAKEEFNSTSMKTKLVFVCSQLALTMVSFLPSYLVYHSRMAHLLYIGLIFTISVFNGASFYIEVFSVRYHAYIQSLGEMRQLAKEAQSVVQQIQEIERSGEAQEEEAQAPEVDRAGQGKQAVEPSLGEHEEAASSPLESEERGAEADTAAATEGSESSDGSASAPAASLSPQRRLSLQQISSDLQRTEEEVWDEVYKRTEAFYHPTLPPTPLLPSGIIGASSTEGSVPTSDSSEGAGDADADADQPEAVDN